jgi:hypothetical protein
LGYNKARPHSSLGYQSPQRFAAQLSPLIDRSSRPAVYRAFLDEHLTEGDIAERLNARGVLTDLGRPWHRASASGQRMCHSSTLSSDFVPHWRPHGAENPNLSEAYFRGQAISPGKIVS